MKEDVTCIQRLLLGKKDHTSITFFDFAPLYHLLNVSDGCAYGGPRPLTKAKYLLLDRQFATYLRVLTTTSCQKKKKKKSNNNTPDQTIQILQLKHTQYKVLLCDQTSSSCLSVLFCYVCDS